MNNAKSLTIMVIMSEAGSAKPIDEMQALEMARDLIASFRPDLSPSDQLVRAMKVVPSVLFLENRRADMTEMVGEIDNITDKKIVDGGDKG